MVNPLVYRTHNMKQFAQMQKMQRKINTKHISNNEEFESNNKNKIYAYYEFRIYECSIFIA